MRLIFFLTACSICLLIFNTSCSESETSETSDARVFELRTYTTHDGKLDALYQRFEDHTVDLFEKHGMENIGYWIPSDAELSDNTMIFIISHHSRSDADANWDAFREDPEWQEVYEASHVDGPLVENVVSVFMRSTSYSKIR